MAVRIAKKSQEQPVREQFWRKAVGEERYKHHFMQVKPMATTTTPQADEMSQFQLISQAWMREDEQKANDRFDETRHAFDKMRVDQGPEQVVEPFCNFFIRFAEDKGWL